MNFNKPLNESVESQYSAEELRSYIANLDYASKAEKIEIADKLGLNKTSLKKDDLIKQIYVKLADIRHTKKEFVKEDYIDWNRQYNWPIAKKMIASYLENEPIEFVEFTYNYLKEYYKEQYGNRPAINGSMAQKSLAKKIEAFYDIYNKKKNEGTDSTGDKLLDLLVENTKEFKEQYIETIVDYEIHRYDIISQMKDFSMFDYMSYFGVVDSETADWIIERRRKYWGLSSYEQNAASYYSKDSCEYISDKTINGLYTKPSTIKREVIYDKFRDSYYITNNRQHVRLNKKNVNIDVTSDLPNKACFRYKNLVEQTAKICNWDKQKYINYWTDKVTAEYIEKMRTVAETIRRQHMDEENLSIDFINYDKVKMNNYYNDINVDAYYDEDTDTDFIEHSTKKFSIEVTDGNRTVYARSIFAAEFSVLVKPHFRFICTTIDNQNKHLE